MEKDLVKLGLEIYQVTGILGIMVFLIAVLITTIMAMYARQAKRQAREIETTRKKVEEIQLKMENSLQEMLDECEQNCKIKDLIIDKQREAIETYRRNEIWFQTEIQGLLERVKILEDEL